MPLSTSMLRCYELRAGAASAAPGAQDLQVESLIRMSIKDS